MEKQCYNEIVELHSFFENWFNGKIEKKEEIFQRFLSVLNNNFEIITPSGQKHTRKDIIDLVWSSHASRANSNNPMKIWIENFNFKQISNYLFLVTYEEWQKLDGNDKGRLSTAIFQRCENPYHDINWIHVHETFL